MSGSQESSDPEFFADEEFSFCAGEAEQFDSPGGSAVNGCKCLNFSDVAVETGHEALADFVLGGDGVPAVASIGGEVVGFEHAIEDVAACPVGHVGEVTPGVVDALYARHADVLPAG